MPAIKLRIPNDDAPRYGSGNLSQLAKSRLAEALGTSDWPAPIEPSSGLPATTVSVWLSGEQAAALELIAKREKIPGIEPTASAILHAWASIQKPTPEPAPLEGTIQAGVRRSPKENDDRGMDADSVRPKHSAAVLRAELEAVERALADATAEDLPWDSDAQQASSAHPASMPERAQDGSTSALDEINLILGDTTRPAQAEFFKSILSEFSIKQTPPPVIAAEAATGIGKTRVFLAVMLHWSRANAQDTAVLTAPSYNVLFQTVKLWNILKTRRPESIPDAVTLLGQQEFVSRAALERALEAADHPPSDEMAVKIRKWIASGAPAPADDLLQQRWLLRSLTHLTQDQWAHTASCVVHSATDQKDPGYEAYASQFTQAREARWVFCTHAMLATDVRRRIIAARSGYKSSAGKSASQAQWEAWREMDAEERKGKRFHEEQNDLVRAMAATDSGRLPAIGLLLVDEAHLLEENFARAFATGASIASMMRSLKQLREAYPKQILVREIQDIADAWDILKRVGSTNVGDSIISSKDPAAEGAVTKIRTALKSILARKFSDANPAYRLLPSLRQTSRALNLAASSNGDRSGMTTRISWSPSEHWPSLEIGRYDISRELDFLWSLMVHDRAVLASATLYDDVTNSGIEGTRRTLAVRSSTIRTLPPVRPSWTTEPVTLFIPRHVVVTDKNRETVDFYRPSARYATGDALQEWTARWRQQVAGYIATAYAASDGGALVLLTSHQERGAIALLLGEQIPPDCLIQQRPGSGIDGSKQLYLRTLEAGRKPLLIAVGGAWTGLDLSGDSLSALTGLQVPANQDTVLTDLIIPNAPLGANRSLTHQYRREFNGAADVSAAAIMMRQGIGRLVRREGLPRRSRRLHFLDARMHDPRWAAYFTPIKRILSTYISTREF